MWNCNHLIGDKWFTLNLRCYKDTNLMNDFHNYNRNIENTYSFKTLAIFISTTLMIRLVFPRLIFIMEGTYAIQNRDFLILLRHASNILQELNFGLHMDFIRSQRFSFEWCTKLIHNNLVGIVYRVLYFTLGIPNLYLNMARTTLIDWKFKHI